MEKWMQRATRELESDRAGKSLWGLVMAFLGSNVFVF